MKTKRDELEKEFFARIPKARKIDPFFRAIFDFMYQAHIVARRGTRLLNIYTSQDFAGNREEVYREKFFAVCEYEGVDFWHDTFIREGSGQKMPERPEDIPENQRHTLPFSDQHFDVLVTTKYIMEHVSEPEKVVREFHRVLKPGGEAFVAAAHVRRQHQKPYDYFRYTEFGLEYLFKKAGFSQIHITPTNGAMGTFGMYAYFFVRGLGLPRWMERLLDSLDYWMIRPFFFLLDRLDNGYGRDLTQYFLVRARK